MPAPLDTLRTQINDIDHQLVALLNKRAAVAVEIGIAKGSQPIYDPVREAQVLEQVSEWSEGPLTIDALQEIYRQIIAACRTIQQPRSVAYLGPRGTYAEEAARALFGAGSQLKPYASLDLSLHAAEKGETDLAVLPIENSTEGSITRTLDLLLTTNLHISAELSLPIHHQLLSQSASLADITEVAAHPQALAQCREWLATHLPHAKQRAAASNAEAAEQAARTPHLAAIAGPAAATIYDLTILARNIEDQAGNTTRFIALSAHTTEPTGNDRTSLVCSVPNQPGTLHTLLATLAAHSINLTKLESRPAANALWDYVFYIDLDGHHQDPPIAAALKALATQTSFVKLLGSYPKA